MARPVSIPKPYSKSGQLVVCLRDARTGTRRTVYLGADGTPEARREYARVLAEWEAADRVVAPAKPDLRHRVRRPEAVTVAEVVLQYFRTVVKARHRDAGGTITKHGEQMREALRMLRVEAGDIPAVDFGPKLLRTVRTSMADTGRFCRPMVNKNVRHIVNAFKWAVSEELVPVRVYEALRTLEPIKAGEVPELREYKVVQAVPDATVDATLPHLSTPLRGLVELMRLTGARCGELCALRPLDIDTTGGVWRAELKHHKTAHRAKARTLRFGPRAQNVLAPFLTRDLNKPLFSPAETVAEVREKRRAARTTPRSCGNTIGTNRSDKPRRQPGEQYTTHAVGKAIERACKAAFPAPEGTTGKALKRWHDDHGWTAHQLRHSAATAIRKAGGIEAAAVVLGHSSAVLTDATYAERDDAAAVNVLRKIG